MGDIDTVLDDASLNNLLSSRRCFTIEGRSMKIIKLSAKGENYDVEPIVLRRPAKSEEEKKKDAEQKLEKKRIREQEKQAKEQERLLRKAIKEEERERKRKLKQKKTERKEDYRVEKVKTLITFYHINDETSLKQLWIDKLIRKVEYIRCADWRLYTVGQVYAWVESHNLPERMEDFRKHTVQRLLKIASFHDPELARLIPYIKFSGIQKANRAIRLSHTKRELEYENIDVKIGDVLRWNYTKEEGIVVGFDYEDGERKFIVRQNDGTEILFEDDPKLFIKVEGEDEEKLPAKSVDTGSCIKERKKEHSVVKDSHKYKKGSVSNEMEVEHVILDSHGKIINSIVTSTVNLEGDEASK